MKRKVVSAIVIATMMAAMMSGCGGGGSSEGGSSDGTVEIQFMHQQVEQERQDAVQALIDKF